MRLPLAAFTAAFVLSLLVSTVFAIDATRGATRKDVRDSVTQKEKIQEKQASRSAILKERLAKFRDKKKAEKVLQIDANLNKINENRVAHFKKFLDNASKILSKLQALVNEAKTNGKDTAKAETSIANAKLAISSANSAASAQGTKEYTIEATSEGKVKDEARLSRDLLHSDLQSVKKLVTDAKQAVAAAIRVAATSLGGNK